MSAAASERDDQQSGTLAEEIAAFYALLENHKDELKKLLPDNIDVDMFIRVAKTAIQRNPGLLELPRRSLMLALQKAAQQGLLPDGREGALVPRKDQESGKRIVFWQPMVWGILKLGRLTGEIRSISAHIVYEGEPFAHVAGEDERIEHKIVPECVDQGLDKARAVYCIITSADGTKTRRSMTAARVRKIKAVSRASNGPWKGQFEDEMWIKSIILYTAKHIDTDISSPAVRRFRDALETDMEADFSASDAAKTAMPALRVVSGAQPALPAPEPRVSDLEAKLSDAPEEVMVRSSNPADDFGAIPMNDRLAQLSRGIRDEMSRQTSEAGLDAILRSRLPDLKRIKSGNDALYDSLQEQGSKKRDQLQSAEKLRAQLADSEQRAAVRSEIDRAQSISERGPAVASDLQDEMRKDEMRVQTGCVDGEPKRADYPTHEDWEAAKVSAAIDKIASADDVTAFRNNKLMIGMANRVGAARPDLKERLGSEFLAKATAFPLPPKGEAA